MFRKLHLKVGDIFIVLLIILLAVTVWFPFLFPNDGDLYAEIYQNNQLIKNIKLSEDYMEKIELNGEVHNTIVIEGKTVRFAYSTCPDQVCVHTGILTKSGQVAVCLPNHVLVKLTGGENLVDAIA